MRSARQVSVSRNAGRSVAGLGEQLLVLGAAAFGQAIGGLRAHRHAAPADRAGRLGGGAALVRHQRRMPPRHRRCCANGIVTRDAGCESQVPALIRGRPRPTGRDEPGASATRSEGSPAMRPMTPSDRRSPRSLRATALIAALLVVAACDSSVAPSPSPAAPASAAPSLTVQASPSTTPSEQPSPASSPDASAQPQGDLAPGALAVTVSDRLRVRSKPEVDAASVKYQPVLPGRDAAAGPGRTGRGQRLPVGPGRARRRDARRRRGRRLGRDRRSRRHALDRAVRGAAGGPQRRRGVGEARSHRASPTRAAPRPSSTRSASACTSACSPTRRPTSAARASPCRRPASPWRSRWPGRAPMARRPRRWIASCAPTAGTTSAAASARSSRSSTATTRPGRTTRAPATRCRSTSSTGRSARTAGRSSRPISSGSAVRSAPASASSTTCATARPRGTSSTAGWPGRPPTASRSSSSPADVTEATRLVLVNAIYLKANWAARVQRGRHPQPPVHDPGDGTDQGADHAPVRRAGRSPGDGRGLAGDRAPLRGADGSLAARDDADPPRQPRGLRAGPVSRPAPRPGAGRAQPRDEAAVAKITTRPTTGTCTARSTPTTSTCSCRSSGSTPGPSSAKSLAAMGMRDAFDPQRRRLLGDHRRTGCSSRRSSTRRTSTSTRRAPRPRPRPPSSATRPAGADQPFAAQARGRCASTAVHVPDPRRADRRDPVHGPRARPDQALTPRVGRAGPRLPIAAGSGEPRLPRLVGLAGRDVLAVADQRQPQEPDVGQQPLGDRRRHRSRDRRGPRRDTARPSVSITACAPSRSTNRRSSRGRDRLLAEVDVVDDDPALAEEAERAPGRVRVLHAEHLDVGHLLRRGLAQRRRHVRRPRAARKPR